MTEQKAPPSWLSQLREAVVSIDRLGEIKWSNSAGELLLRGEDPVIARSLKEFFADPEVAESVFRDLAGEEEFGCEADLITGDGFKFTAQMLFFSEDDSGAYRCLIQPQFAAEDKAEKVALQAVTLTNRLSSVQKEVHELSEQLVDKTVQLAEEKRKTEAVLASMGEGLLVVDHEGVVRQINQAACKILDTQGDEVLGTRLEDSGLGSKISSIAQLVHRNLESGGESEDLLTRVEIQEKVIELSMAPIRDKGLESTEGGIVINLRDVTKQAEIDRMKSELISIVSHELRSPLANITGYIDLVAADAADHLGEESAGFLQVAQRNAAKLSGLVDDMLDLSRLDAGKVEMNIGDVEMDYLINFVYISFRNEAEMKNIQFERVITNSPHVAGDVDRIQQVLVNLVSNAIRYTPEGGRVEIDCASGGDEVVTKVTDTGIGIHPEDQARLFQRFFRVRSIETKKIAGTGLGLSIAKSIVDAHGGRLLVTSEVGKGSTFTVVLPTWQG